MTKLLIASLLVAAGLSNMGTSVIAQTLRATQRACYVTTGADNRSHQEFIAGIPGHDMLDGKFSVSGGGWVVFNKHGTPDNYRHLFGGARWSKTRTC